jgi:hypothetical protein
MSMKKKNRPFEHQYLARIIHGGHEVCMGRVISAGLTAGFQGEF